MEMEKIHKERIAFTVGPFIRILLVLRDAFWFYKLLLSKGIEPATSDSKSDTLPHATP